MACNCGKNKNVVNTITPSSTPRATYNFSSDPNFVYVRYIKNTPMSFRPTLRNFYSLYGIYNYGTKKLNDTFYIHRIDYEKYKGRLEIID